MSIDLIKEYFKEKITIAQSLELENIMLLTNKIIDTYENDGSIYLMANGGPVGAVDGFATDLKTHPFVSDDKSKY